MNSIGTFGSYTQARLAIYASQAGLSVTGNNIANINTFGSVSYTHLDVYKRQPQADG